MLSSCANNESLTDTVPETKDSSSSVSATMSTPVSSGTDTSVSSADLSDSFTSRSSAVTTTDATSLTTTTVSLTTTTTAASVTTTSPAAATTVFKNLSKTVYAVGYPALYSSASESSPKYCFINPSSGVTVLAVSSDGVWYNVAYNGIKGFAKSAMFTEKKPQTAAATTGKKTTTKAVSPSKVSSATKSGSIDFQSRAAGDQTGIVDLTNRLRSSKGLSQLSVNSELSRAAAVRAKEIAKNFDHTRPDGNSCFTAVKGSFSMLGENIAYFGTTSAGMNRKNAANQLYTQWLNSEGHYKNMVKPEYNCIGVGVYYETRADGMVYVYGVQIFGRK